jgi:hypothetical protein
MVYTGFQYIQVSVYTDFNVQALILETGRIISGDLFFPVLCTYIVYLHGVFSYIIKFVRVRFKVIVFNATFNNISVISWQSVLLVEETRVPGENLLYNICTLLVHKNKVYLYSETCLSQTSFRSTFVFRIDRCLIYTG